MQKTIALFWIISAFASCTEIDDAIKYYEELITSEIYKAENYKLPQDASEFLPINEEPNHYGTYDFVVVGAGSAGSVIANRLSENKSWKILLLEAGIPGNDFSDIPAMQRYLTMNEYNWGFSTTTQDGCCLNSNGICPYPRGKALGGSSTINGMVYSRGNKLDYDKWNEAGNEGWSYNYVLPYFKKSENSMIYGNNKYHSTGGYLNVELLKPVSKVVPAFLKANIEMETPIGDYNGKYELVAQNSQVTHIKGKRMSTEKAFLYPANNRTNLKILTKSYVTKVVIDKSSKVATGVIFSHENIKYIVNVTKEIIVSAGVFGSPQILMLSGVGPATHLDQHGIQIIQDLAVGQSLKDHMYIELFFTSSKPELEYNFATTILQYLLGFGVLTTNTDAVAFYNMYFNKSIIPNVEIMFYEHKQFEYINTNIGKIDNHRYFGIAPTLMHPKSVGKVSLKSSNPYEYPLIDVNCLKDSKSEDLTDLLNGIDLVLKLLDSDSFKKLNPQLIPIEACTQYEIKSKDYWKCAIEYNSNPGYHGVGTCRMGPTPGDGDVVDNKLRVYGIKKLRVADASIIPFTISGHTNAPSIMIGERVADFIKEDYTRF